MSEIQNIFVVVIDILCSLFTDDIWLSDYLKINRFSFCCFIFNCMDSNQNFNIQQERINTQKKEHFILSRFIRMRNRRGGTKSSFLLKVISGISGMKNYNRRGKYFYVKPEGRQNLKGGDLGIKVGLIPRKTPWNCSFLPNQRFFKNLFPQ